MFNNIRPLMTTYILAKNNRNVKRKSNSLKTNSLTNPYKETYTIKIKSIESIREEERKTIYKSNQE